MKVFKYIISILTSIAILLEFSALYVVYDYFTLQSEQIPIDSKLFWSVFGSIIFATTVYVICYIVGIILVIKNKPKGYLITGIVSLIIFSDSTYQLIRNNAEINFVVILTSIFWLILVVSSFYANSKLRKEQAFSLLQTSSVS